MAERGEGWTCWPFRPAILWKLAYHQIGEFPLHVLNKFEEGSCPGETHASANLIAPSSHPLEMAVY